MSSKISKRVLHRRQVAASKTPAPGPKFPKDRKHKRTSSKPSWPSTDNQRAQSRPLIILRPVRLIRSGMLARSIPDEHGVRSLNLYQRLVLSRLYRAPKWILQAMALSDKLTDQIVSDAKEDELTRQEVARRRQKNTQKMAA